MGVDDAEHKATPERLSFTEISDKYPLKDFEFVSVEHKKGLTLPVDLGVRYLQEVIEYGEKVVSDGKSFKAGFKVEVPLESDAEFIKTMANEGYWVEHQHTPATCGFCGEDASQGGGGSYSIFCRSCGGMTAHMDCDTSWFYNHADHECFSACCDNGHKAPETITEQNFINTTPAMETFIEEDDETDHRAISKDCTLYDVSHYHLCENDRLAVAHRDYLIFREVLTSGLLH